jgi:RIO-like serine/threonine protein kinase|tara:strand:+ start:3370 stop:4071 length:702 start_codon:yes stop_codon:yes gene_type:complete
MSAVGIQEFSTTKLLASATQLGLDGKEGKTFAAKTRKRFSGQVFGLEVSTSARSAVAVKTFQPKKSINRIHKEAELQQKCAAFGASPSVLGVSNAERYIVMTKMATLPVETLKGQEMPEDMQYAICGLMGLMDEAGVLHNDMNARNVMLDTNGRPWMIDFGLSKVITKAVTKKHGAHPNIKVTLWGLVRGFNRCQVTCPIMEACLGADTPEDYIEQGKEILMSSAKRPKRKRK